MGTGVNVVYERPGPSRQDLTRAAAVFAVGLSASLVFISACQLIPPESDALEYYRIARNLAAGNGFSFDGAHPYTYRPPLFPLLLGMWFRLAGASALSAAVYQCLLHGLSAAASYLLFRALRCTPKWATVLSLAVALQPTLVSKAAFILQEPTLLFFTTAALLATVIWLNERSGKWASIAGISWGVVTLGKSVTLIALPLAMVYWFARGGADRRNASVQAALFTLFFLVALAPWTIRNYLVLHRVVPVNDQGTGMLEWNVVNASPAGGPDGESYVADLDRRGITGEQRKELLWRYIGDHLRHFLVVRVYRNAVSFASPAREWWWAIGRYGPGESRPWYWTLHDYFHRFLFLFLLFRVFQVARGRLHAPSAFIALFCLAYWGQYALLVGGPRFGVPVYPALLSLLIPGDTGASATGGGGGNIRSFAFSVGKRR